MGTRRKLKLGEIFSVTTTTGLGFNRSGFRFSKVATLLTAAQMTEAILAESKLIVEIVEVEPKKEDDSEKGEGSSKGSDSKPKE